jgi:P pilus assembly chaperone PapD
MKHPRLGGALIRALLIATLCGLVPLAVARADIGVAIDIGRIDIDQKLAKGGSYQLPVIGVRNPGTEPAAYQMGVSFIQDQAERRVPDGWFRFSPETFTLEPGATRPVRVSLDIPTDADPDEYAALLQAQIAPSGDGAQVGAAAAAQVTFTVEPSTILEAWLLRGRRQIAAWSPWSYLLPLAAVSTVAAGWLRHRYRIGFRVERRP